MQGLASPGFNCFISDESDIGHIPRIPQDEKPHLLVPIAGKPFKRASFVVILVSGKCLIRL